MSHVLTSRSKSLVDLTLEGDGTHPLRLLRARQKHRAERPGLYAQIAMTLPEMIELLPHSSAVYVDGTVVSMVGDWRPVWPSPSCDCARWVGIDDRARSPLWSRLATLVAEAIAHEIERKDARELLHVTGFLDRQASPLDQTRFLSTGRSA